MGTGGGAVKVMLVITKGETGGAQTHLLSLCDALRERISFVAAIGGPPMGSPLNDGLRQLGIPVQAVPQLVNSLSPLNVLGAVRALLQLIRQDRPDLIHAHSAVAGVAARLAGWISRVPVIYTVHGFGFKREAPALQRHMARAAEYTLAPLTRHMICVSEHERGLARLLPLASGRISVIHNGVPDTPHRATPAIDPARVIMVARLAPPKRPDLLIEALALLRDQRGQELPASLVGGGPDLQACRTLADQHGLRAIEFTGDVSDVPQRLARHAVFVLVSDHEGLPISVIEAMRAGLPVVASDLPGLRELLPAAAHEWLVPNDARALAAALARLAASPGLRQELGAALRRRYEELYTPVHMARAVEALYGQIAHHESHRGPAG